MQVVSKQLHQGILIGSLACLFLIFNTLLLSGCQATNSPLKSTLQSTARSSDDFLKLAKEAAEKGDYQAAFLNMTQALKMNPKDPDLYLNLGWLYLYTDEPDKAAESLEKLAEMSPNSKESHHLAGAIYQYLEQDQDAVTEFEEALTIQTKQKETADSKLYFDLATSQHRLHQEKVAIETLNKGLALVSDSDINTRTNFLFSICSAEYALKAFSKALISCQKAMATTDDPEEKERITDFMENMKLLQTLEEEKEEKTN
jgi:tetratricopeptide (TPR) repeat protein